MMIDSNDDPSQSSMPMEEEYDEVYDRFTTEF